MHTIVVIEDDRNISDLVAMYLRKQGYRVLQAEDAETGLEYIGARIRSSRSSTSACPEISTVSTCAASYERTTARRSCC